MSFLTSLRHTYRSAYFPSMSGWKSSSRLQNQNKVGLDDLCNGSPHLKHVFRTPELLGWPG